MKDIYVLGVVEEIGGRPIFRYLSPHVSRNKAFETAKEIIAALSQEPGAPDYTGMKMYEHDAGDRKQPDHFYLIRQALGEIKREVGGGTHDEEDQPIVVLEYKIGDLRARARREEEARANIEDADAYVEDDGDE